MQTTDELFDAVRAGDIARVQKLVGANPALVNQRNERGHSVVLIAQYHHKHDVVQALLAAHPELDIFDAASVGRTERLAELLDANPELLNAYSNDGFYPLGLAAFFAQPEAVALLLARGADVLQVARNPMRLQPLHAAAAGRSMAVVRMLVEAGAPVNAKQQAGFAPLHEAVTRNNAELVRYLLDHGADPRLQNDAGTSPIGLAAEKGFLEILKLLKR
ncbi:MAG TPA: ankyrin repeat domain-containing protein [Gemmatimonadales bacterium]|nr:ankyrin repeat domain-containing protein [Gemmatimonadales bacterium]